MINEQTGQTLVVWSPPSLISSTTAVMMNVKREWKRRDKMKYQGKSVQRRRARCSSIATILCCRIFLEDILKGKSVERRFRLTSRWATGLPLPVLDGNKIIDGLLKRCL
ncbi:hypothetical protein AAG906_011763 [Vitis piasezkii]